MGGNVIVNGLSSLGASFFGFLKQKTEQQAETYIIKDYRKVLKAIEYAEKYIRRNKEVYDITDKELKKLEDRFFKHN